MIASYRTVGGFSMRMLTRGSSGPEVGLLRRLLNTKSQTSPRLPEAGTFGAQYNGARNRINFGPKTDAAVRAFQRFKHLSIDGDVGPITWRALGITIDIEKPVTLASQPSNDTCYAAAATMVLGLYAARSWAPGPTPPGKAADDHWAEEFSKQFSWTLQYGVSPRPSMLAGFLHSGAFWIAGNLPFPSGPSYHAVVVGAIWGDGSPEGTMILIYDPWPPNRGEKYGIILGDYARTAPEAFRYIIHR